MTKLEQLNFEYLEAKGEMEAYQSDEKCAHKKVLEWEKRMKEIEKEIKEIEESESDKKLKESILFIKDFCNGERCFKCKFHDENIYARTSCKLRNTLPEFWTL